ARVDAADVAGPLVRQVDIAVVVDRHAAGAVELGLQRRAAVAAAPRPAAAGDAGDDPGTVVDPPDRAVAEVRDVKVPVPVLVEIVRVEEARIRSTTAVAYVAGDAVASERPQEAVAID